MQAQGRAEGREGQAFSVLQDFLKRRQLCTAGRPGARMRAPLGCRVFGRPTTFSFKRLIFSTFTAVAFLSPNLRASFAEGRYPQHIKRGCMA